MNVANSFFTYSANLVGCVLAQFMYLRVYSGGMTGITFFMQNKICQQNQVNLDWVQRKALKNNHVKIMVYRCLKVWRFPFSGQLNRLQMAEVDRSNIAIKITEQNPVVFQQPILPPLQNPTSPPIDMSNHSINPWHLGSTITLNFFYLLLLLILQIPSTSQLGKYFLIVLTFISFVIYLTLAYKFSSLIFMFSLKPKEQYQQLYRKYTRAQCILNFCYTPTRNNIDQAVKTYEEQYQQIKIVDRSPKLVPLDDSFKISCVTFNKKYYYCNSNFKGHVHNEFNLFIQKCKANYDKKTRKLLSNREKIELTIIDFVSEVGFEIEQAKHLRVLFFVTYCLGFGAYFQYFMKGKVLRRQVDIIKEICPKQA